MNPLGSFSFLKQRSSPVIREVLTSDRTYYVSPSGSDNNSGLDSFLAFKTIQKAVDTVCTKIDMANYQVTIQLVDGTYTTGTVLRPYVGVLPPIIQGNSTTPDNTVVSTISSNCFSINSPSSWTIKYLKTQTATSGYCISANGSGSNINIISVNFGNCAAYHVMSYRAAFITISGNYTISGGAQFHLVAQSAILDGLWGTNNTITLTGTPNFSVAFIGAYYIGSLRYSQKIFSGAATGKRYIAEGSAVIDSAGAGTSYFPGNVAGTTSNGGLYL